jgi:hypothetical protein
MLRIVKAGNDGAARRTARPADRVFYDIFLPIGAAANLALGLFVLSGLGSQNEFGWLELGTGAFCCMVAGWLAAASWSRFYWSRNMARQVAVWHNITDTFFTWLEDAPLPVEAVQRLKSTLEEVVPTPAPR